MMLRVLGSFPATSAFWLSPGILAVGFQNCQGLFWFLSKCHLSPLNVSRGDVMAFFSSLDCVGLRREEL